MCFGAEIQQYRRPRLEGGKKISSPRQLWVDILFRYLFQKFGYLWLEYSFNDSYIWRCSDSVIAGITHKDSVFGVDQYSNVNVVFS